MAYRRNCKSINTSDEMDLSPIDNNIAKFSVVVEKELDSQTMIFLNFVNLSDSETNQNELFLSTSNGLYQVKDNFQFEYMNIESNA